MVGVLVAWLLSVLAGVPAQHLSLKGAHGKVGLALLKSMPISHVYKPELSSEYLSKLMRGGGRLPYHTALIYRWAKQSVGHESLNAQVHMPLRNLELCTLHAEF